MIHEFSRTEMLLGQYAIPYLAKRTVMVFGVGGVGSHCIEALVRGGIGRLILIDADEINLTNINRQSIAYHSTLGKFKTQVMAARIADINPEAEVQCFETFILPENSSAFFAGITGPIDYIVDAIDTVSAKISLIEYASNHNIPIISSMGTGNKLQGELFKITDLAQTSVCPLCRIMRKELKTRGIRHVKVLYSPEQPLKPLPADKEITGKRGTPGSVSFVPPVAGLLIAGEVIRDLLKDGQI